jgi:hypothetical protein
MYQSFLSDNYPCGLPILSNAQPGPRMKILPANAASSYLDHIGHYRTVQDLERAHNFFMKLSDHVLRKTLNLFTSYVEALLRLGELDKATSFVFGGEFAKFGFTPDIKFILTFISLTKKDPKIYLQMFKKCWPHAVDYYHPAIQSTYEQWEARLVKRSSLD